MPQPQGREAQLPDGAAEKRREAKSSRRVKPLSSGRGEGLGEGVKAPRSPPAWRPGTENGQPPG